MAEAAVETPAARFFCHQCAQEVSPVLPDYLCSRCHTGFIEELSQPPELSQPAGLAEYVEGPHPISLISDILIRSIDPNNTSLRDTRNSGGNVSWAQAGPSQRQYRIERPVSEVPQDAEGRNTWAERFLQQFIVQSLMHNSGLATQGNFPLFLNLHGNPGDYAWGRGGWNAIITQLINQLDGTGPPPLPREKIEQIPTVNISQEQVDKNLQCTVCMEDFKLGEPVRLLPCQHNFHDDCIIPWLELHGTCPICRKLLEGEGTQDDFESQVNNRLYAFSQDPGPSGTRTYSDIIENPSPPNDSPGNRTNNRSAYEYDEEWD